MNPSLSRMLVALPFSVVISTAVVLLTWSVDKFPETKYLFNTGILYTILVFGLMCIISIKKIIETESHDPKADQLEAMLAASVMTGNPSLVQDAELLEEVEFDYTNVPPQKIPRPEVDNSLQF